MAHKKDEADISEKLAASWKCLPLRERAVIKAFAEMNPKFQSLVLQAQPEALCDTPQPENKRRSSRFCRRLLLRVRRHLANFLPLH